MEWALCNDSAWVKHRFKLENDFFTPLGNKTREKEAAALVEMMEKTQAKKN